MNNEDEEKESEEKEVKKINKTKDQILDESFKEAELIKTGKSDIKEPQTIVKRPFIKIGFLIVIIALIGLIAINFFPFMHINYETENSSINQFISYEDFIFNQIENDEINSLFESTCYDCSENSDSYIGLSINDFTESPKFTIYVFYIMIFIGGIFTIFTLVDRKKKFSENTNIIVHSIFIAFIIFTGIIILILNIKFLNVNLLQNLNKPYLRALGFIRIQLLFFIPYFMILISLVIFVIGLILMKTNLNKALDKYTHDYSKEQTTHYKYGSKV